MGGKEREACGRCSVTTVLDATEAVEGDESEGGGRNPFEGERIELDAEELRSVVRHEVLTRRVKDRLDALATRLVFG